MKRNSTTARSSELYTFMLMVHGPEYGTGEEVVINPECFPHINVNDLLEICQPERDHPRLILQVTSLAPVRGKLQISVLKDIATQFGLEAFQPVMVQVIEPQEVTLEYIELTFKDQFLSRADIWRYKVAMQGKCVYVGKNVACLGIRAQVRALLANDDEDLQCGVINSNTKLILRSRSSRLFWLIQMSAEMWEFAPDGELYYEKLINRLLRVLISKWNESAVSHSVTIIAFSRSFYDKNQFPADYDPLSAPFNEPNRQGFGPGCQSESTNIACGYGPTIHLDPDSGRYYEDFYKVVVMNYTGPDWNHLILLLKREFATYHETHRWRGPDEFIPAEYDICHCLQTTSSNQKHDNKDVQGDWFTLTDNDNNSSQEAYVQWKVLPHGVPSRATDGNILEAINVTLNVLDKHYMDRDLNRTGQSIVTITAGTSVFRVSSRNAQITKQRMMDNGVGMDLISLTTPPMHVVPLFICSKPNSPSDSQHVQHEEETLIRRRLNFSVKSDQAIETGNMSPDVLQRTIGSPAWPGSPQLNEFNADTNNTAAAVNTEPNYLVPHWMNITFLDFDCKCTCNCGRRDEQYEGADSKRRAPFRRLLSSRSQSCECQQKLNQKFMPMPPFRMFDPASPTKKLSFPVSLKKLIKGYPRNAISHTDSVNSKSAHHPNDFPKLDEISSINNTFNSSPPTPLKSQWQLSRSPDVDLSLLFDLRRYSPRMSTGLFAREAQRDYDAEVFNVSVSKVGWPGSSQHHANAFSPSSDYDRDITSATFDGSTYDRHLWLRHGKLIAGSDDRASDIKEIFGDGGTYMMKSILSPRHQDHIVAQQMKYPSKYSALLSATALSDFTRPQSLINPSIRKPSAVERGTSHPRLDDEPNSTYRPSTSNVIQISRSTSAEANRKCHESEITYPDADFEREVAAVASIFGKSIDSSQHFLVKNSLRHSNTDNVSYRRRDRPFTSNMELSTPPPSLLSKPPANSLQRSMTMRTTPLNYDESPLRPFVRSSMSPQCSLSEIQKLQQRKFGRGTNTQRLVFPMKSLGKSPFGSEVHLHDRKSNSINPFKYSSETTESASQRLTHNRRRWSHLFPASNSLMHPTGGETLGDRGTKQIYLGPNWKSLTSPAILPLTIDYFPSLKDLRLSYTESFYTLTLPTPTSFDCVPKYTNHGELLIEMVCQRLARDFQLVAIDPKHEVDSNFHRVPIAAKTRSPKKEVQETSAHSQASVYCLSMGHRIHQLMHDPELQTIEVKRYFQRSARANKLNESKTYTYSLWVDLEQSFQPVRQTFDEFPQPEENWNSLDHLLCGYHDEMSDPTRFRRIQFAIIPPVDCTHGTNSNAASTYVGKFSKFIDYLQTRIAPSEDGVQEKISVHLNADGTSTASNKYAISKRSYKILLRASSSSSSTKFKSEDTRTEWVMVHLEDQMTATRNYHLGIRWLACSGNVVDEFITTIKRKGKQAGLDLRRIPEYSCVSYLQIHPLVAPIFLPVPVHVMDGSSQADASDNESASFLSILVEKLNFVFDDERLADSNGIGYGVGIGKEERKHSTFSTMQLFRTTRRARTLMTPERWQARGYKQYMHRYAPVFIRLIHNGLIWFPSYDYDEKSNSRLVEELYREVCTLIQASTTLHDLVTTCCSSTKEP